MMTRSIKAGAATLGLFTILLAANSAFAGHRGDLIRESNLLRVRAIQLHAHLGVSCRADPVLVAARTEVACLRDQARQLFELTVHRAAPHRQAGLLCAIKDRQARISAMLRPYADGHLRHLCRLLSRMDRSIAVLDSILDPHGLAATVPVPAIDSPHVHPGHYLPVPAPAADFDLNLRARPGVRVRPHLQPQIQPELVPQGRRSFQDEFGLRPSPYQRGAQQPSMNPWQRLVMRMAFGG